MARQWVTYNEQLLRLHPSFDDCPSPCSQRLDRGEVAYLPDPCEACDVRAQFGFFRRGFEADIREHFKEGEKPEWTFEEMLADVRRVRRLDREAGGRGYPEGCDAVTARSIDVLRAEEHRPVRIAAWEAAQKRRER